MPRNNFSLIMTNLKQKKQLGKNQAPGKGGNEKNKTVLKNVTPTPNQKKQINNKNKKMSQKDFNKSFEACKPAEPQKDPLTPPPTTTPGSITPSTPSRSPPSSTSQGDSMPRTTIFVMPKRKKEEQDMKKEDMVVKPSKAGNPQKKKGR